MSLAIHYGHISICRLIIDNDTRLDREDSKVKSIINWVCIEEALDKNDIQNFQLIMDEMEDKNPKCPKKEFSAENPVRVHGDPLLHFLAEHGNAEFFKIVFEQVEPEDKNPFLNGFLQTPLHIAAKNGHLSICKIIIASKNVKDKNPAQSPYGYTPLHYAAENGHISVCQLILNKVVNKNPPTQKTFVDNKPYQVAGRKLGETPLHKAASNGHFEIFVMIASRVKDKNPPMQFGQTPLHLAAKNGHMEICKYLATHLFTTGKNTNPKDKYGKTPIDYAERIEIKRYLNSTWKRSRSTTPETPPSATFSSPTNGQGVKLFDSLISFEVKRPEFHKNVKKEIVDEEYAPKLVLNRVDDNNGNFILFFIKN